MKKPIMWVAALLTASCTPALKVEVANTTPTERDDETVEIAWSEVAALKGVTPDNIVVLNDDNEQIPSQVLFRGGTEPQALIFQTDADPMESKRFKLVTGQRENYPAEAFCALVAERVRMRYGTCKIFLDFAYVIFALLICWRAGLGLGVVREGTVIFALLDGVFINLMTPAVRGCFDRLDHILKT